MSYIEAIALFVGGAITKREFDAFLRDRLAILRLTPEMDAEQAALSRLQLLSLEADEGLRPALDVYAEAQQLLEQTIGANEFPTPPEFVSIPSWNEGTRLTTSSTARTVAKTFKAA